MKFVCRLLMKTRPEGVSVPKSPVSIRAVVSTVSFFHGPAGVLVGPRAILRVKGPRLLLRLCRTSTHLGGFYFRQELTTSLKKKFAPRNAAKNAMAAKPLLRTQ